MFRYHDLEGRSVEVSGEARVTLASPRPCDGCGANTLVVIDEGGVRRHRPARERRGELAAALVGHRV